MDFTTPRYHVLYSIATVTEKIPGSLDELNQPNFLFSRNKQLLVLNNKWENTVNYNDFIIQQSQQKYQRHKIIIVDNKKYNNKYNNKHHFKSQL